MVIYKTINLLNGKFYIGQNSTNDPDYLGSGLILSRSIKKYGKINFKKEIIEVCDSKELLNAREIFWIQYYKEKFPKLCMNIQPGGTGGDTWSKHPHRLEFCKKMSNHWKTNNPNKNGLRPEQRRKMIESKTGISIHSTESKIAISIRMSAEWNSGKRDHTKLISR